MRFRAVQRCSLLLSLAAVMACEDEGPAAPPVDEVAETVNPWTDPYTPCYPSDVETTRTINPVSGDTTETVYTGFEGCGPGIPGIFDMWLQGIELWDPTGEAPQGSGRLELDNRSSWVLNAPSGVTVAIQKSHAPAIAIVEFEPAVREVSFAYSVRWPAQAQWGGQTVSADSVEVQAVGGFIWDRVTLHANSPDYPAPYQVWDTVTLSTSSDLIRYLYVLGQVAIDDLKIVSGPRPKIKCTSVTRGQNALCQVDPSQKSVVSWSFQPTNAYLPPVDTLLAEETWSGIAAMSGTVTVELSDAGGPPEFMATGLLVIDRPSQWQSQWDYDYGITALPLALSNAPFDPSMPNATDYDKRIGANCDRQTLCAMPFQRRVTPDPSLYQWMGATPDSIEFGPNASYWYIETISYNMFREGNLRDAVKPTSTIRHPVPNAKGPCKNNLGTSGGVTQANFYEYNLYCTKGQSTAQDMLNGWIGHEGMGYGGGIGHESAARAEAGLPNRDPWVAVDTLVTADLLTLDVFVQSLVGGIGTAIDSASAHSPYITGKPGQGNVDNNWSGDFWYYSAASGNWAKSQTQQY